MTCYAGSDIVTDGLVLCLDAGNRKSYPGSGNTWFDLSGNENHGALTNGPSYNNGRIIFDGSNDYINYGTSGFNSIRQLTTLTLGIFCYCTGFSNQFGNYSWASLFSIDKYQNGNSWRKITLFMENDSGTQAIACEFFDGAGTSRVPKKAVTVLNRFLYVVSTIDANSTRLYINGSLENELSGMTVNSNPQTSDFTIGARINTLYDGYFKGDIPQVQVYNRALSQQEIFQNFNATRGRFGI